MMREFTCSDMVMAAVGTLPGRAEGQCKGRQRLPVQFRVRRRRGSGCRQLWQRLAAALTIACQVCSPSAVAQTPDSPPPQLERPVVAEDGMSALRVNWTAHGNVIPPVTGYDVQYRDLKYRASGEENWTDGTRVRAGTSTRIANLSTDTAYQVRVRAVNAGGEGAWSRPGAGATALWESTLTAGVHDPDRPWGGYLGYQRLSPSYARLNNFGDLSPNSFSYDGVSYDIFILGWYRRQRPGFSPHSSTLEMYIIRNTLPEDWTLRVQQSRHSIGDAHRHTFPRYQEYGKVQKYLWLDPGFNLQVSGRYEVAIARTVPVTSPAPATPSVPQITSDSGFAVTEGDAAVAALTASDADTPESDLSWSISGGADQGEFSISAAGALAFAAPKDFENPDDADADGVYRVTVQVSDGERSDTMDLVITLTDRNEAPSADAGADQPDIAAGATVTLAGTGADPDAGDTLSYAWTQTSGDDVALSDADKAAASFTAPDGLSEAATLTFTLRVTDAGGLYQEDTVSVTVGAEPPIATIAAAATPVTEGAPARFIVTLDRPVPGPLAVAVTVSENGERLSGSIPATVAIAAGETSGTLDLATADDTVIDSPGTVTATLAAGTGYVPGAEMSAVVTVSDNDTASFSIDAQPAVIEEGGSSTITLSIANGVTFAVEQPVTLTLTGLSAEDYTLGTVVLAAGETGASVALTALEDELDESPETASVSVTVGDMAAGNVSVVVEEPGPAPDISGTPQVGAELRATPERDADYQWLREGEPIRDATDAVHTLTADDAGQVLSVRVNARGRWRESEATIPIWPAPGNPPLAAGVEELYGGTISLETYYSELQPTGYSSMPGRHFGALTPGMFSDGVTELQLAVVNKHGKFAIDTSPHLTDVEDVVIYWNDYRIGELYSVNIVDSNVAWAGQTPQPETEYIHYSDGASDGVKVALSVRRTLPLTDHTATGKVADKVETEDDAVDADDETDSDEGTDTDAGTGDEADTGDPEPLTGSFSQAPAGHDGESRFTLRFTLSEEPNRLSYRTVRDSLFEVSGGTIAKANRAVAGSNREWVLHVDPAGAGDVTLTLRASTSCDGVPGVCAEDGRRLQGGVRAVVAGPLTGSFSQAPAEHDGESRFTLRFALSEDPHGLSYRTVRDSLFEVSGGEIASVKRAVQGSSRDWVLHVDPAGAGDVTLTLRASTSCDGVPGVCAEDGRRLQGGVQVRVAGPATLSVADAAAEEGSGAVLEFVVTLSRARTSATTVDYATADGTARAGEDYQGVSATLTFAAGETSKTVSVAVLDDNIDDDGETLTLRLSDAVGARIADAEATGTIRNSDPLPKGWLARFGRTASMQTLTLLEGRFEAAARADNRLTLGGRSVALAGLGSNLRTGLRLQSVTDHAALPGRPEDDAASQGTPRPGRAGTGGEQAGHAEQTGSSCPAARHVVPAHAGTGARVDAAEPAEPGADRPDCPSGTAGRAGEATLLERTLWTLLTNRGRVQFDERRFLAQSGFALSLSGPGEHLDSGAAQGAPVETVEGDPSRPGHWSLWGRGALTRFSGVDGALSLDGDVLTGLLGLDYARERWLAGAALAYHDGRGTYASTGNAGAGELDSTLITINPYLRYALTERLSAWGTLGYGTGTLRLRQQTGGERDLLPDRAGGDAPHDVTLAPSVEADMSLAMGAVGLRGVVYAGETSELALKTDALWVRTASAETDGMQSSGAHAGRIRLLLSGQHQRALANDALLSPHVELGLRYDAGDAETGFGMELGGGLRYADPQRGLIIETRARALLAHEDGRYREWGLGGSLSLDPGRLGRGLAVRLDSGWGVADSGAEAMWQRQSAAGIATQHTQAAQGRVHAELGYGLDVPWTYGILTPYGGVEMAGAHRALKLGWRFELGRQLSLSLDGERRETGHTPPDHGIMLRMSLPW